MVADSEFAIPKPRFPARHSHSSRLLTPQEERARIETAG